MMIKYVPTQSVKRATGEGKLKDLLSNKCSKTNQESKYICSLCKGIFLKFARQHQQCGSDKTFSGLVNDSIKHLRWQLPT